MENERSNKQSMIIIAFLCAMLFGLAVAYAALSAALNITFGAVNQNSLVWNVGFETGTILGTKTGSSGAICGEATATATTVSIANTTLETLYDKCVYKLKIMNTGTIDAMLKTIAAKTPAATTCDTDTTSRMVCGNITYKLTTDAAGTSLLGVNNLLVKETGTLDVYLTAEYTGTTTGSSAVQNTGGFTLNYEQN